MSPPDFNGFDFFGDSEILTSYLYSFSAGFFRDFRL